MGVFSTKPGWRASPYKSYVIAISDIPRHILDSLLGNGPRRKATFGLTHAKGYEVNAILNYRARRDEMSQMSKDRVEFVIPTSVVKPCSLDGWRIILVKAFGYTTEISRDFRGIGEKPVRIRCRPSQFARFMIYQAEEIKAGGLGRNAVNTFTELHAKLVAGDDESIYDVSNNPHRHR